MSYEITATRRRPQGFEDVVGQDFVVSTLQKSINAGKIAPAYLFSGPRGCGKTSSARILAKALNCEQGPTGSPCGLCQACQEITKGTSFDVLEIDGASNTSVNDVRQIKEEVLFPPNSFRYKIYIIDEVHMLSTSAFNALLKTIEEPPPYVVFIFATTEIHKVPATIKSRCQQYNFRLVSVEQLKALLTEVANEIQVKAEDEALFWIAKEATGSVRDAYTLFDQIIAFSDGFVRYDAIREKLGLVGVDRLNPLVDHCVDRNLQEALLVLDEIIQSGISIEQCTIDLANYFRNLLFIKAGITKESLLGQKKERFSAKALEHWSEIQIERALGICLQLYRDLRYSLDVRCELELAVSRLAWITDFVSSEDMKKVISQARNLLLAGTKEKKRPFEEATGLMETNKLNSGRFETINIESNVITEQETVNNPFEKLKKKWDDDDDDSQKKKIKETPQIEEDISEQEIYKQQEKIPFEKLKEKMIEYFQSQKNMISAALTQTSAWQLQENVISFYVETSYIYTALENEKRMLSATASSILGSTVTVSIALNKNTNKNMEHKALPERVELVRQMFRGTIV